MDKKIDLHKLIRITTIPLSLEKLLEGQLTFMNGHYDVIAIAAEEERLQKYGSDNKVRTFWVEMTRKITPILDLKSVIKLYRYFKSEKPLIVHTHTPKAGIVGMLAAKLAGVPIRLHTVAGMPLMETLGLKRKILNLVEKFTYSLATKVYPNSKGLQEIILKENFAKPSKLKVLGKGSSNGIDTAYFDPELYSEDLRDQFRRELKIEPDQMVFIFVGRIVSEKGINELVSSFVKLHKIYSSIRLLLIGPFEEDLDPISPENYKIIQTHEAIIHEGYQADIRKYLSISQVLAFPSYREGFPNVVMQAGAMEVPAIVTNINGCNEIITENSNGLIIPVKDEKALFNAMEKLILDQELLKDLRKNARLEITSNYERSEFWKLLLQEYQSLEKV